MSVQLNPLSTRTQKYVQAGDLSAAARTRARAFRKALQEEMDGADLLRDGVYGA